MYGHNYYKILQKVNYLSILYIQSTLINLAQIV
jgi:hypothetical protein